MASFPFDPVPVPPPITRHNLQPTLTFFFPLFFSLSNKKTGHQNNCPKAERFGSSNQDQGCFGTAVAWDISALYKIPDGISSEDAGPLMCAGGTVWSPLHTSGVRPGDRVGIIGVGGLGHLAIQFASKMGMDAVVFSTTAAKKQEALGFGATEFYTAADLEKPGNIEPVDILMITSSVMPDLST